MRTERLFRILGLVDEDLIEEAGTASSAAAVQRRGIPDRRFLAAAACVTLVCGVGLAWLATGGFRGMGAAAPGDSAGGGGGGHDVATEFMSYAGPVFPLTTAEPSAGLTAERSLTWDFAPGSYEDGESRQWGAGVTDVYALTNTTPETVTCHALYPFSGSFSDLAQARPTVEIDGVVQEAALCAGPYSGGFRDAGEGDGSTWNLADINSWEDYQTLLESGAYQAQALSGAPALDQAVTVYEFTDFSAPLEDHQAATQAVSFTIDERRTTILTYGFNGMEWDDDGGGYRRYSYFVPGSLRRDEFFKVLVVLGDDIGEYTLAGYENGACETALDGVSCTVTRSESTLGAVLEQACRVFIADYGDGPDSGVSLEMFRDAAAELLIQYGALAGDGRMDRYFGGRLDDVLSDALGQDRVFYLSLPVTVPAEETVTLSAALWKRPSYDFFCGQTKNRGVQGYDFVTRLGSTLDFTALTAALKNTGTVEILRQNLGFDLENGVTEVILDLAEEHYYLEIKPLEEA